MGESVQVWNSAGGAFCGGGAPSEKRNGEPYDAAERAENDHWSASVLFGKRFRKLADFATIEDGGAQGVNRRGKLCFRQQQFSALASLILVFTRRLDELVVAHRMPAAVHCLRSSPCHGSVPA